MLSCTRLPISIHALREEGDKRRRMERTAQRYFYPRPPRGGRLRRIGPEYCVVKISIHALREEGDYVGMMVEN